MLQKMVSDRKTEYISYAVVYAIAVLAAKSHLDFAAAILLIAEALFLFVINFKKTGSLVDLKGLFILSWIGGEGIACLKLSKLQSDWSNVTWVTFFLIYLCFQLGYDLWLGKRKSEEIQEVKRDAISARRILICILGLMVVSIACFTLEAAVVGYIPLFNSAPHAYSHFHISGVHYFTISCILIPTLTVLYTKVAEKVTGICLILLFLGNITAVAIPILCVSRFQLLFAVGFAAVTYLMLYKRITWKMIVGLFLVMIPVYVLLTVARRHDVDYLNGIFEMKNPNMPIFITQPYIYVANNFENFNCMVEQLTAHTWGLQMLFPVFALTGLKFVFPQLVAIPDFVTKTELTTLTMFYDAYYDFGILGTAIFAFAVGLASATVINMVQKKKNPMTYMFYGQIAIYLGLAFFTTWFSNPTTWFWLALTVMMYWFVGYRKKGKGTYGTK